MIGSMDNWKSVAGGVGGVGIGMLYVGPLVTCSIKKAFRRKTTLGYKNVDEGMT